MSEWQPTISGTSTVGRWTSPEGEEVLTNADSLGLQDLIAKMTAQGEREGAGQTLEMTFNLVVGDQSMRPSNPAEPSTGDFR